MNFHPSALSRHTILSCLAVGLLGVASGPVEAAWPYTPPARSPIPDVQQKDWPQNPIDSFVLSRLEKVRLRPAPSADKETLLRRVTFDLTGLVPTPAERERFLADNAPDAYERLVDRLLGAPQFGERWASHWLDVVRYAESEGYKLDRMRPEAYRYRDYVIRAFNDDLPYDRFLRQQLAGDELEPTNPDALIATGFLRLQPEETNGSNYRQIRQDLLNDVTDVFGATFLGLTVGCARCHNHKFDPISQKDYYALQAFFAPLTHREGAPLASAADLADFELRQANWEEATTSLRDQIESLVAAPRQALIADNSAAFDAETQEAIRTPEDQRTPLQQQLALLGVKQVVRKAFRPQRRLNPERRAQFDQLQTELGRYDGIKPYSLPSVLSAADVGPVAPPVYRLAGGNLLRPKELVGPGFPHAFDAEAPKIVPPSGNPNSTGYRSALARWLTRPDHPLTARIVVNRLWQHYFGRGLVGTPNDFGVQGEGCSHPELLDYLAVELVRKGWSLKAIHRLIVTSAAYRQSSRPEQNPTAALAAKADPANHLLWHAQVERREAESIRDVVLQLSGELNLRMYGPSARPELPEPLMVSRYSWYADERSEDRNRRSVYVLVKRNMQYPLFGAFDGEPDHVSSCPTRATTVTAPQALVMLNGALTAAESRDMALDLLAKHGADRRAVVRAAYLRAFGRTPAADEVAAAEQFLDRQARLVEPAASGPLPRGVDATYAGAVADFCHALMNAAELLYVD